MSPGLVTLVGFVLAVLRWLCLAIWTVAAYGEFVAGAWHLYFFCCLMGAACVTELTAKPRR